MTVLRSLGLLAPGLPTLGLLVLGLVATGCTAKSKSAMSAESHAPGTTLASAPAGCAAYPAGSPGVIRTFCTGTAKVKLTVNGVDHMLQGGECAPTPTGFSFNLGVVSGPDLAGPKPDYVGLTTPVPTGAFSGAVIAVHLGGKGYSIVQNSGQVGPAGGTFEGVAAGGGPAFTATFTC